MTDDNFHNHATRPRVSIIVNCYNGERFLRESLDSALGQSFTDWELIFWDNKSSDSSADIFLEYSDQRFRYFLSEEFASLGDARNLAVSMARGMWLAFMDCDDVWPTNKLALQLTAIDESQDRNIGFVYGLFQIQLEGRSATDKNSTASYYSKLEIQPHGPVDLFSTLAVENFVIFSSALISTVMYRNVGGIDPRLRQNEDYDLLLKISQHALAICVNATCVIYRIHADSNSQSQAALSYDEFDLIYNALPDSVIKFDAIQRNKSRFAAYKMISGEFFSGIYMLVMEGSVSWFARRLIKRLLGSNTRPVNMPN